MAEGKTIIICNRNEPASELRPLPRAPDRPRPIGLARGQFSVPSAFFEPLADDVIRAFHGDREG